MVQVLEFIRGELSDLAAADERRSSSSEQQQQHHSSLLLFPGTTTTTTTTAAAVSEIIDIELIQQQIDHGAVDWESWSSLVRSIVLVIECLQDPEYAKQTREMYVEICKKTEKMKKLGSEEAEDEEVSSLLLSSSLRKFWWQHALCDALGFIVARTCVARRNSINRK